IGPDACLGRLESFRARVAGSNLAVRSGLAVHGLVIVVEPVIQGHGVKSKIGPTRRDSASGQLSATDDTALFGHRPTLAGQRQLRSGYSRGQPTRRSARHRLGEMVLGHMKSRLSWTHPPQSDNGINQYPRKDARIFALGRVCAN